MKTIVIPLELHLIIAIFYKNYLFYYLIFVIYYIKPGDILNTTALFIVIFYEVLEWKLAHRQRVFKSVFQIYRVAVAASLYSHWKKRL